MKYYKLLKDKYGMQEGTLLKLDSSHCLYYYKSIYPDIHKDFIENNPDFVEVDKEGNEIENPNMAKSPQLEPFIPIRELEGWIEEEICKHGRIKDSKERTNKILPLSDVLDFLNSKKQKEYLNSPLLTEEYREKLFQENEEYIPYDHTREDTKWVKKIETKKSLSQDKEVNCNKIPEEGLPCLIEYDPKTNGVSKDTISKLLIHLNKVLPPLIKEYNKNV